MAVLEIRNDQTNDQLVKAKPERLGDSNSTLVFSILKCLRRVFHECGRFLISTMAAAGSILLPLLDEDDPNLASCTMEILKVIVTTDYDVIYRPLLELSGRGMPPFPLPLPGTVVPARNNQVTHTPRATPLTERCEEILCLIDSLPEQSV